MPSVELFSSVVSYAIDDYKGKDYSLIYSTDYNTDYTDISVFCDGEPVEDQDLIDELVDFKEHNLKA